MFALLVSGLALLGVTLALATLDDLVELIQRAAFRGLRTLFHRVRPPTGVRQVVIVDRRGRPLSRVELPDDQG